MFSGIGGFERGIWEAYRKGIWQDLPKGHYPKCIGYSEINKYAKAIYNYHYPNHKNYGNAKDIIPEEIEDFNLLVGGFPCQSFSIAGKRGGFDDTRGTLFFDVARVLKAKRPEWFLLENVKGLCSHESGKTMRTIYKVLTDLGYSVGWEVVNSCKFGVPQNRERIFFVGHIAEEGRRVGEILPIIGISGKSDRIQQAAKKEQQRVSCKVSQTNREDVHIKGGGGNERRSCKAVKGGEYSVSTNSRIRRLTPVECERLQGFPDGWTAKGTIDGEEIDISDTQRYKALGNAVTVNVIEAFMQKMIPLINK